MKGITIAVFIVAVLIGLGFLVGINIHNDLSNKLVWRKGVLRAIWQESRTEAGLDTRRAAGLAIRRAKRVTSISAIRTVTTLFTIRYIMNYRES